MYVGSRVLKQLKCVYENVVIGLAHNRRRMLRINPFPSSHHVGMDIGLPVDGSLLFPLQGRPVQLQEAGFDDEYTSIPLLEDLLGSHSFEDHSAQHIVVLEQRWQSTCLPMSHSSLSFSTAPPRRSAWRWQPCRYSCRIAKNTSARTWIAKRTRLEVQRRRVAVRQKHVRCTCPAG